MTTEADGAQRYEVEFTQFVRVELKPEAFTDDFMEEFRSGFFPFYELRDHAEHIGQLTAREVMNEVTGSVGADQFVEGYGPIGVFVERATFLDSDVSAERVVE